MESRGGTLFSSSLKIIKYTNRNEKARKRMRVSKSRSLVPLDNVKRAKKRDWDEGFLQNKDGFSVPSFSLVFSIFSPISYCLLLLQTWSNKQVQRNRDYSVVPRLSNSETDHGYIHESTMSDHSTILVKQDPK